MFALIFLLCIGAACAHENDTVNVNEELSAGDNLESNNIKEIIDNCKDSDIVNLEDKTYYLDDSNETHIILNKSITVQGISDKTVIDGKNTSLFLDVDKIDEKVEEDGPKIISLWSDGYDFKYLGKNAPDFCLSKWMVCLFHLLCHRLSIDIVHHIIGSSVLLK